MVATFALANLGWPEIIIIGVQLALIAFWGWMLIAFFKDPRITSNMRIVWILLFVFFGAIAAILYFFMYYTKDE